MKVSVVAMLTLLISNTLFAQMNIGIDYYRLGDYQKAKVYLEKTTTNMVETNYYLGEVAFAEGNYQKAEEYYNKGLSENSEDVLNQIGLAKLKLRSDTKEASSTFFAIQKKNGKTAKILIAIAYAYLDNNLLEEAETWHAEAKKGNQKNPNLYILEGDIIVKKNDVKKLGEAGGKYEMANYYAADFALAYVKTAQVYENVDASLAIEKLKTIIEKQPDYIIAYAYLGKLYTLTAFYQLAIETYKKYIDEGIYSVDDLDHYARALYFSQDYDAAMKVVNMGLAEKPDHFVLNRYKLYIYEETKDVEKGLETATKFFKMREPSGYISTDYTKYASLLNSVGRYDDAIIQYNKAIEKAPNELTLYTEAATLARNNKDYAQAADYLKKQMEKKAELSDDGDYVDNIVDANTLGYDYYSAGFTIGKNQPLAEKLMKNETIINMLLSADASLIIDSLKGSINYFSRNYALYYLHKADSVFDILIERIPTSYTGYRFKALTKNAINPAIEEGEAKPYYEKVVEILATNDELTPANRRILLEAYNYLGYYYYLVFHASSAKSDKDSAKENAIMYWTKVLEIDPENTNGIAVLNELSK